MPVEDGCWLWTGYLQTNGYGSAGLNGKVHLAHRLVYQLLVGPITEETLDHLCRVRSCVNPAHLEPVSLATNIGRGQRANQTHCKRGHLFDTANTYYKDDRRFCRACHAWRQRQYAAQGKRS